MPCCSCDTAVNVQAWQGRGHIQAAALESSKTSWQLPPLGIAGSLEEQDIRLPPLPPGRSFSDEYEVLYILLVQAFLHIVVAQVMFDARTAASACSELESLPAG